MATRSHALLSASSSSRWLNCPPSARLSEEVEDVTSDFAAEGRSNRKYADDNKVAEVVTSAGLDPFEKKLLSITELQKRIGKTHFDELVAPHVMKPPGKPTLVPRSDKREEINSAAADFNDEN